MSEAMKIYKGVKIPKKELKMFYLDKKISTSEIAKKFNCCQRTTLNKLLEYQIPIRSISEGTALIEPHYPRRNFSGNLEEKAYLIGFRLGDLSVHLQSKNSQTVYARGGTTKIEFVNLMKSLFSSYGHVWIKPNKEQVNIKCYLNKSFDFLLPKKDLIEPWILKNKNYFAAFLAGYTDAEGCFHLRNGRGAFALASQDKNILRQIHTKLLKLGILHQPPQIVRRKGTIYRGVISNKDGWCLSVFQKDALLKLIDLINPYLKHADRRKRMEIVKNNIIWRNKKYNRHQASKYDKLYLNEGVKI